MRMVYYKVKRADGSTFHTYSYSEATNGGNHIVKTCLAGTRKKAHSKAQGTAWQNLKMVFCFALVEKGTRAILKWNFLRGASVPLAPNFPLYHTA